MSADAVKEEAIFDAAIQIEDAAARAAYLNEACGGDTTLRAAVDELLRFHDTKDDLLASPAVDLNRPADADIAEQPGTVIGRYRIVERIGEGGFGAVYRAEQIEPVRRDVALKIIKPGMDTREIIGRFEAERQALAMMNHPNIAMVLDAGSTPSGRPYFVMELVAGLPIDEFCDARRLSVSGRLRLFLEVCRGVQHAHQKGVVHRDLKPSNLLVVGHELSDGNSPSQIVPKVIDFGIAKALHQPAAADSRSTTRELRTLLGTPEYMSPEQVALDRDVDTRADIYALGGVLYKLLTGSTPLDFDVLRRQDFDELCRAIREQEPPPPSARVGRVEFELKPDAPAKEFAKHPSLARRASMRDEKCRQPGEFPPTLAESRATNSAALRRMLRGDLDWIVMKALEKDRARRYETVGEMAADIERYLNHEPVSAGPPSAWYRASKFVRRNRLAVAAAAAVILAVVAGGAAAMIGFVRANEQARIAEKNARFADEQKRAAETARDDAERQRGEAVARRAEADHERQQADIARTRAVAESDKAIQLVTLLEELVGAANPDMGHAADFTVRQLLDEFARSKFDALAGQPEIEATLRRTIGRAYWQLGDMPRAGPQLERAFELRRAIHEPGDPRIVDSQVDFARYLVLVSRFDEALELIQPALEPDGLAEPRDAHVWAYSVLGRIHDVRGRYADAEASFQQAVDLSRRVHGDEHLTTLWLQPLLVHAAGQRRDLTRAESMGRQFLARQTELLGDDHTIVGRTMCWLALALLERGSKIKEAERLLRRALEIHRKQLGTESSQVVQDLVLLSTAERMLRRPAEAERLAREAVAIAERVTADRDFVRVLAHRSLAFSLRLKDPAAAADHYQKAIDTQRGIAIDRPMLTDLLFRRAAVLREIGRGPEAADSLREAHDVSILHAETESGLSELGPEVILYYLACTHRQLGDLASANRLLRESAETCEPHRPERPLAWCDWIDVLLELREKADADEAAKLLDQASEAAQQLDQFRKEAPTVINRIGADLAAATLLIARGDLDAAEPLIQSCFESARKARLPRAIGRAECLRADLLVRRKRYEAAETLLLSLDRLARAQTPFQVDDVLLVSSRLVKLYETWDNPAEAARWRESLPGR